MRARVFVPGGLCAPNDLAVLTAAAAPLGVTSLRIGERQDWTLEVDDRKDRSLALALNESGLRWVRAEIDAHNVVTSAPAIGLASSTSWLTADTFREALNAFAVSPRLRISITDPRQGLVPSWASDVNFTAAENPDTWRLALRIPGRSELLLWPVLFSTDELARAAFLLEDELVAYETREPDVLIEALAKRFPAHRPLDKHASEKFEPRLPLHEGMIRLSSQAFCLGLWRRSEDFPLSLLDAVSRLCRSTGLGFLGLTPWKTLLIPGIQEPDRRRWEDLLVQERWNTRHASQELGWLVGEDKSLVRVKNSVTRRLVRRDVRTYGKTISLGRESRETTLCLERGRNGPLWSIWQSDEAGAEGRSHRRVRSLVPTCFLARALEKIILAPPQIAGKHEEVLIPATAEVLPQCPDCGTIYDAAWGDPVGGIAAGTAWSALPESWQCPVCETPRSRF